MKKILLVLVVCMLLVIASVFLLRNGGSKEHQAANHVTKDFLVKKKDERQDFSLRYAIHHMTLNEKIGQMIIAGIPGTKVDEQTRSLIHDYKVGGFIFYSDNLETPKQSIQLVNRLKQENKDNPYPLFMSVDQEGGAVSRLPGLSRLPDNQTIGKRDDPAYSYTIGRKLGRQTRAFGMNLDFAPVMDINSNPNNPVIGDRSFGDDQDVVSKLGIRTMKGIKAEQVIPVIKHFPGHGDTSVDSHEQLPKVDKNLRELSELELIPFQQAIAQGADAVLVAHILLPNIGATLPSSMSRTVITDILRKKLGYNGVVITDDMTMKAVTNHYDIGDAAVKSVQAGSDIVLIAHGHDNVTSAIKQVKTAIQRGDISEEQIEKSVERIIQLKLDYGIDDKQVNEIDVKELNK
ncbi:beta-N-acetylhexosaminidase [Virgibacillus halophilus]